MLDQAAIDALRRTQIPVQSLLIDGVWRPAAQGGTCAVTSPIDGSPLTTIAEGTAEDVNAAVAAAKRAFEDGRWSRMAPATRKRIMHRLADLIEKHALELAVLGVRDNGTEISMAINAESGSAAATFRYYAEAIDKVSGEIAPTPAGTLALLHREPVGVVGVIVPWNFPLMIGSWKIAPALAAGNSVVLKPAESASLSLLKLAAMAQEAGLPDGVLNVVTGHGSVVGEAIGLHMDVDVLAFTGSGGTGRRLLEYASRSNMKRCYLELGGKSPNVVFADAPDLEVAANVCANGIFRNAGQVCIAGSRLLVERKIHAEFTARVAEIAASMTIGDPLKVSTQIGAVHSPEQLAQNLSFVERAIAEGANRLIGGERVLAETGGTYMSPAVLDNVAPDATVFRTEVFGPVLSVTPFDSAEEAIHLANATEFGLSGAVWTSNISTAHRVTMGIRSGQLHVNTYGGSDITTPMGGMKQSGNGVDKSLHALDKYVDLKTVWMKL
ncbi:aldehyde dehydrogenase family protein [Thioclava sp. FR2]|uniref:aldehyde dehydrogenase family protein n=1 Tax=Thioclava sp. FR2 TaxID=3445780 RepID=UPI003EBAF54D